MKRYLQMNLTIRRHQINGRGHELALLEQECGWVVAITVAAERCSCMWAMVIFPLLCCAYSTVYKLNYSVKQGSTTNWDAPCGLFVLTSLRLIDVKGGKCRHILHLCVGVRLTLLCKLLMSVNEHALDFVLNRFNIGRNTKHSKTSMVIWNWLPMAIEGPLEGKKAWHMHGLEFGLHGLLLGKVLSSKK